MNGNNEILSYIDTAFSDLTTTLAELQEKIRGHIWRVDPKFTKVVAISAGHGGLDANGIYTTPPKWGKWHDHGRGKFHQGSIFYEGVFNRVIAAKVIDKLQKMGVPYAKIYDDVEDWPLSKRSEMINDLYYKHNKQVFGFDLHSNASNNGLARGFSVFSSPGQTESDKLTSVLWEKMEPILGRSLMRSDTSDGDRDFEAHFWMLTKTIPPMGLPECLFFNNYEDAIILMNSDFQENYAQALVDSIIWGQHYIQCGYI